jgi:iron complex transport system ATP-binding protein
MFPLEGQNLSGGYGNLPIVHQLTLALRPGEWLSLVGPNGSGKSTLLKLLSNGLPITKGSVLLDGELIQRFTPNEVARRLSLLPQQPTIPEGLTVRELVSLGRSPHQPWWQWQTNSLDMQKVQAALALTQLEDFSERLVAQLSGGERQRAFLALALAQETKLLLLDEPITFLDLRYQLELLELLKAINQEKQLTIITVLHDLNLAARYSDRLVLLHEGKIWAMGSPLEVITPEHLAKVFGIEAALIETPVGLQVFPLRACHSASLPTTPMQIEKEETIH